MQSSMERIKTLLKQYHVFKMQVKNNLALDRLKQELEFVENCINSLPEEDYKVILAIYIDKTSIRKVAESIFMSHSGLKKRLNRLVKTLALVYDKADFDK